MKYGRIVPTLHCRLLGQIFVTGFHPTPATAAPRWASAPASAASPASGPGLSVNRTGTTLVAPSGNVTLIATLQADDGFTPTDPAAPLSWHLN